jgi:hypothetical protein
MSDYVNIAERIEPYTVYVHPQYANPHAELLDTKLRLVAAILDRPGVAPTIKADALTEIARIRELL